MTRELGPAQLNVNRRSIVDVIIAKLALIESASRYLRRYVGTIEGARLTQTVQDTHIEEKLTTLIQIP